MEFKIVEPDGFAAFFWALPEVAFHQKAIFSRSKLRQQKGRDRLESLDSRLPYAQSVYDNHCRWRPSTPKQGQPIMVVALKNGEMIGFCAIRAYPKENGWEDAITALSVSTSHRRQGLATQLVQRSGELAIQRHLARGGGGRTPLHLSSLSDDGARYLVGVFQKLHRSAPIDLRLGSLDQTNPDILERLFS